MTFGNPAGISGVELGGATMGKNKNPTSFRLTGFSDCASSHRSSQNMAVQMITTAVETKSNPGS